jgi:hypothetical protein
LFYNFLEARAKSKFMCDMQCATLHVRGSKALLGLGTLSSAFGN